MQGQDLGRRSKSRVGRMYTVVVLFFKPPAFFRGWVGLLSHALPFPFFSAERRRRGKVGRRRRKKKRRKTKSGIHQNGQTESFLTESSIYQIVVKSNKIEFSLFGDSFFGTTFAVHVTHARRRGRDPLSPLPCLSRVSSSPVALRPRKNTERRRGKSCVYTILCLDLSPCESLVCSLYTAY